MKLLKIAFLLSIGTQFLFAQNEITRVEPPNWWIDMKNPKLQLLVYGNNIGDLNPIIEYEGYKLKR